MITAFISGHLDCTQVEFDTHYKDKIDEAIIKGHRFVVGDARGADAMAQEYLAEYSEILRVMKGLVNYQLKVTVYHAYATPRHNLGNFPTSGNHPSQTAKDKAMTLASDYDIAWIREGKEESGTARNIARRQQLNKDKDQ